MTTDELGDVIRDAFTGGPPPDASEIVRDPDHLHLENEQIKSAFGGKTWTELPIPVLTYHRQAVFFFTPEGWAYYLPAYMLAIFTHYEKTDTMVDALLSTLIPSRDNDHEADRRARIARLNDRQRATLRRFVVWIGSEHPEDLEDEECHSILASLQ